MRYTYEIHSSRPSLPVTAMLSHLLFAGVERLADSSPTEVFSCPVIDQSCSAIAPIPGAVGVPFTVDDTHIPHLSFMTLRALNNEVVAYNQRYNLTVVIG